MPSVCPGVDFENVAREWRCKYAPENDKKSNARSLQVFETLIFQH